MKRKTFIKQAVLGAVGISILPRHVLGGPGYLAPSDRINLGYIGVGKQAPGLLRALNECPESLVLAVCDVDTKKLDRFVRLATEANTKKVATAVTGYRDYRELLERSDIDAVVVATPDHWHAQVTVDAAKRGKDIYCEKPLALTIAEGRAMVDAVRKHKRVLQTGSMQRSWQPFRHACELIINGYIGEVREINVSVGGPVRQCDLPAHPVPDYLDWDQWVGPSLYRGYHPTLSPPIENDKEWAGWRHYRDFGGGYVTDWGAHMFDIVQWALGMDDSGPVTFQAPGDPRATHGVSFRYANGVTVHHRLWGPDNAIQFIGSEGTIEVSRSFLRSNPESIVTQSLGPSAKRLYRSDNHYQDWLDAIKTRTRPVADVEVGHRTATVCNIVNIVYELQRDLNWNPKKEVFDDPSANLTRTRPYRAPWNFLDF